MLVVVIHIKACNMEVIVNELEEECHTISDIQQLIAEDRYQMEISPDLNMKVESAQRLKKELKASLEKIV